MFRDFTNKIKVVWRRLRENILVVLVIILVALFAFGLGRLSVFYGGKGEFKVLYPNGQSASALLGAIGIGEVSSFSEGSDSLPPPPSLAGTYVASKTGSTYFFPWCPLAIKIPVANRVYFNTRASAESAGYHAGRCNGL
ncbi:MAG: hypothetical protein V4449_03230 [Patescibacteria group bacterium]